MKRKNNMIIVVLLLTTAEAGAQSSSMYLEARRQARLAVPPDTAGPLSPAAAAAVQRVAPLNPELERASLFAIKTSPPHEFGIHDLVTVIVREQKTYESDASLETNRDFRVKTKIDEFFRFVDGHLGAATFSDGRPNIDVRMATELEGEGDAERSDRLTFRLTAEIVDIKPNGLLVLAGKQEIAHNEEVQVFGFTGTCRSVDITADNTVLSTQVFNQHITLQHRGAVNDAAKRGWGKKLLDLLNPF